MAHFMENDAVHLDDEPEQDNNEIELSDDGEDNFNFDHSEEESFQEQQKLSTIYENNDVHDSTTFSRAKNPIESTTVSNARNEPLVSTTIPKSENAQHDSTIVLGRKNAQLDSTTGSNARNAFDTTSFSTTKLAELDAKFQFCQNNINRMDINEIMASVNLKGRSKAPKDTLPATTSIGNSFKVTKPSVVETLLQAKKDGTFQREPLANLDNSIINEEIVDKLRGKKTMLKTARSTSTIASQNTSIASDQVVSRSCYISVDKPVLAFGFVGYKTSRKLCVKISNDTEDSLWLQPVLIHSTSVQSDSQSHNVFKLTDQSSFSLEPHSTHEICVIFEPNKAVTYNAQLRLRLMSKDEPEFLIRMFGYGARAELELRTQNFEKIDMGTDGVGICEVDRSMKQARLILTNRGQRDAFAHIFAVDANNQPLSSSVVSVEPSRIIVQKNTKEYAKITVNFRNGLGSTTMIKTRSVSQMSVASTHSTRTLHNESLARLRIIWGEERMRRRLKCYLNNNTDENVPVNLMDYVTSEFRGEGEFKTEKIVGRWDLVRFTESSRLMTVQFVDLHVRPQSSTGTLSRPPSSASIHSSNQTLANTMAASQNSHHYSIFSNGSVDDETMPVNTQRSRHY